MKTNTIPPPTPKINVARLADEISGLQPGESVSLTPRESKCARMFALYHGWQIVTRKEGTGVRFWRIA